MADEGGTGSWKGRVLGVVLMGLGAVVLALSFAMMSSGWVVAAVPFGPICLFLGLAVAIEGPEIPVKKMSRFSSGMAIAGTVVGFGLLLGMMIF